MTNNSSITKLEETYGDIDDEDFLACSKERMDQNSPELWPEQIHGVTEFTSNLVFEESSKQSMSKIIVNEQDINRVDKETIRELGTLTVTQLMEKFQTLKNQSYQLGLQESKEMTRGKFLNVLGTGLNEKSKKGD